MVTMRTWNHIARLLAIVGLSACRGGLNYESLLEPRYAGPIPACPARRGDADLLVVTYNIEFARRIDAAIAVLRDTPELAGADVVLLQEMTADATARVASALGMGFVYYPAIYHRRARQDFGNAVLSRWPIEHDAKLVLPHRSRYAGTQRAATVATIRVDTTAIRVYSTHLGTPADLSERRRREQLDVILRDAARFPAAVVGGDMNMGDLGPAVQARGFRLVTSATPKTTRFGRWDHVLVRGTALSVPARVGVVDRGRTASDHSAVWVRTALRSRPVMQPLQECARREPGNSVQPAPSGGLR
jgi:endonuclease/exonuclease/phosphatase family metal-dependent hydrolase